MADGPSDAARHPRWLTRSSEHAEATFLALVIEGISGIDSQIDAETHTTYRYAPARAVVMPVSRNPYLGPSTVELASFRLHP